MEKLAIQALKDQAAIDFAVVGEPSGEVLGDTIRVDAGDHLTAH